MIQYLPRRLTRSSHIPDIYCIQTGMAILFLSAFEYLDSLTGINGTFGVRFAFACNPWNCNHCQQTIPHINVPSHSLSQYLLIVLVIMAGHAWANHVPVSGQPTGDVPKEEEEQRDPPRNFTSKQLLYFDGTKDGDDNDKPVYLALHGTVFDVSEGRNFYGPGGPYETFAGHEAGVALAKMSFDVQYLDDLAGCKEKLNHGEKMELENWIEKFTHYRCYPVLGRLIPDDALPNSDRILSKEELAKHTGSEDCPEGYAAAPICVGAGDKVFDVSFGGVTFYGPGCSYHRFAGKDASRALAKMSFEPEDPQNTDVSDLTDKQRKVLDDWIKTFEGRKSYPIVGRLGKEQN